MMTVKKYPVLPMLAVLASTILALAEDTPHNEDTAQHNGGAEYLQELEHSDHEFYVPPVDETSSQAEANNTSSNY